MTSAPDGESAELQRNQLLAALAPAAQGRLRQHLSAAYLHRGQVVTPAREPHAHVYFPLSCLISVTVPLTGGRVAEVGIAGREGFVGLPVLLGTDPGWHAAVCQVSGEALRLESGTFRALLPRLPDLRRRLYQYVGVRLEETMQLAACSIHHVVQQRLARWLLMTQDRVGADTFDLTQEFLAMMLAVRRPYLNRTAQALQQMGCIAYRHGRVVIVDRPHLESAACEDYGIVRAQYERLSASPGRPA